MKTIEEQLGRERDAPSVVLRWWIKVTLQNALGLLPGSSGRSANQLLVNLVNGPIDQRSYTGLYRLRRSIRNVRLAIEYCSFDPVQANVVELGTGWRGCDALLFFVLGAQRVVTTDHEPWLTLNGLRMSAAQIKELEQEIVGIAESASQDEVRRRISIVCKAAKETESIEEFLGRTTIRYVVPRNGDIRLVELGTWKADLFYSESVLQRVPSRTLEELVGHYATTVCKSNAVWFHRTDQRDIHALGHARTGRWALAYLFYSDWTFEHLISGHLTTQNRLRESDFVNMFVRHGLSVDYVESRIAQIDLERMRGQMHKLPSRWKGYGIEDLVARASIIIGRLGALGGGGWRRVPVLGTPEELEQ